MKLKEKNKSDIVFTVILTVLLLAFFALIFYVNLSFNPDYYDGDIYCDINYAREAWKAKSLFPANWVFGNQVYVIATPVVAALLCSVTGNAITAMGIASCVMTVLVFLSYDWMMKPQYSYNQRVTGFLAMAAIVFAKGHIAQDQNGAQIFFTMASYYSCYLITAFIVYGCYIRLRSTDKSKKYIPMCVVAAALSFATGMQSLRQTAVMVLPLVACEIFLIIVYSAKNKRFSVGDTTLFTALVSLANIGGIVAIKFIKFNQKTVLEKTEIIRSIKEIGGRFLKCIGFMENNFLLKNSSQTVSHIAFGICALFVAAGLIIGFVELIKSKDKNNEAFALPLLFALGSILVSLAGSLTTLTTRPVYYFTMFPLLAVCVSLTAKRLGKKKGKIIFSVVAVIFAAVTVLNFSSAEKEITLGKSADNPDRQAAQYMLDNGYDTVYSVFGLSGRREGGERIAIISDGKISAVFFGEGNYDPIFVPIKYLTVNDHYKTADPEKSLYFTLEKSSQQFEQEAKKKGVEVTVAARFGDHILYKASENICIAAEKSQQENLK